MHSPHTYITILEKAISVQEGIKRLDRQILSNSMEADRNYPYDVIKYKRERVAIDTAIKARLQASYARLIQRASVI